MVDHVVEHFGEAVMPDVQDVLGQFSEQRRNVVSPHDVFGQWRCKLIFMAPFQQWRKPVKLAPRVSADDNSTLVDQALQVLMHSLPGARESFRSEAHDIGRMRINVLN